MIKAEVAFDGYEIICNGFKIYTETSLISDSAYYIVNENVFYEIEQAIAYCLEQSK